MSKADELRAKAARVAARTTPPARSAPTPAPVEHVPTVAAPLAKPVRSTVDLAPDQHRRLADWLTTAAVELGRARLTKQEVMAALVRRLLVDDELAGAIKQDLRKAAQ
ncbi:MULTISPECIES: hypothetical protein [unclassified Micromonospora]|uniref:hypothetical protein n=1 Tax=unclassified Micromonospora TaxID=2617518 RepID=UPI0009CAFEBC|nr:MULTISPECIES: hypothetical protein [unclassified Micromonospora]MDI5937932.1 hypothetical protein [Micromonospora sp. DH15]OON27057.1 hypothetical protein BSA16_34030 [Micromonospora sp. Rc5]